MQKLSLSSSRSDSRQFARALGARRVRPILVVVAGGSGSGKTWLADKLEELLRPTVARLSLDSFYLDRSHLSETRRAGLNFDHPRAIDWPRLEEVLRTLLAGRPGSVPLYDFQTHARLRPQILLKPKPLILLEGLWPLRRRFIRANASFAVFLHCSSRLRLRRRISRDMAARGRTRESICRQFQDHVEPMHARFVAPQSRWADLVLRQSCGKGDVARIAEQLRSLLHESHA